MQLARVTGTVVASVKADGLEGVKFLVVQPLDRHQQPDGSPVVAADGVHMAGPGELVYIVGRPRGLAGAAEHVRPGRPRRRRHRRRRRGVAVKIGRVVGTVVSTISAPVFEGRRLLLCDLLDASGRPDGSYLICVDTVGSGAGEAVLIVDEGNSARQVIGMSPAPVRAVVVGVVDQLTADGELVLHEG